MKTLEYNHGNWLDNLLNSWPLCLDMASIKPLVRAGVCRTDGLWHAWATTNAGSSLFYNGVFFIRIMLPFWIGIQIRPTTEYYSQVGFGWKLNGRLGVIFRVQSDKSAAAGTHGPNYGHANGWECGPK